jgi:hypothetical protein
MSSSSVQEYLNLFYFNIDMIFRVFKNHTDDVKRGECLEILLDYICRNHSWVSRNDPDFEGRLQDAIFYFYDQGFDEMVEFYEELFDDSFFDDEEEEPDFSAEWIPLDIPVIAAPAA